MSTQSPTTIQQVQESNARIDAESCPRTAVFVGGTAGIGEAVLHQLALAGKGKWKTRIYVIGRQESASHISESLECLRSQNADVELIWAVGEVSLLADVTRICKDIKKKEKSLDLLFLTTGYAPLGGREDTKEGQITSMVLAHYAKILFIQHLLPLLKASNDQGRVVAVMAGGMETMDINIDDLNFEKPGTYSVIKCHAHSRTMLTMAMEQLAEDNKDVTFVHASPGLVNTGNLNRGWRNRWILQIFANIALAPIFLLVGLGIKESGERMFYVATSAKYGGHGVALDAAVPRGLTTQGRETGGLFLIHHRCGTMANEKVLNKLRKEAKGKIWTKTMQVIQPYKE